VEKAVAELRAKGLTEVLGVPCHVGKADQRENLINSVVKKWGHIDVLVNNAAVSPRPGPLCDIEESVWDKLFDINVKAGLMLVKLCVEHMTVGSNVLFVSSIAAYNPISPLGAYGVTKTTLLGLTKALAQELGSDGIRVNCLAPGTVKTKFSSMLWKNESAEAMSSNLTYLNRLAVPSEMGGAAAFLCSDDGSYITGETVTVAGGMKSSL
jgi:dehydrogenase/reductase SDR family member 4